MPISYTSENRALRKKKVCINRKKLELDIILKYYLKFQNWMRSSGREKIGGEKDTTKETMQEGPVKREN